VNPRTNRPVGYAFVDLKTSEEAEKAISSLSGQEILERKVSVQLARKPDHGAGETAAEGVEGAEKTRASGRGRGRGRGRGGRGRGGARGTAVRLIPSRVALVEKDLTHFAGGRSSGDPRSSRSTTSLDGCDC
jgi:RNA recognition motif-containing protein